MPSVSAIVLAAGRALRMGDENKLLALVDGSPIIRKTVENILGSQAERTCVVLGHDTDQLQSALNDLDVEFVSSPDFAEGMSASLKAGIRHLQKSGFSGGVLICLGDMPLVSSAQLDRLIDAYKAAGKAIIVPTSNGEQGNPVLFSDTHFSSILELSGDVGAKSLLKEYSEDIVYVPIDDNAILTDVDTIEDLALLQSKTSN